MFSGGIMKKVPHLGSFPVAFCKEDIINSHFKESAEPEAAGAWMVLGRLMAYFLDVFFPGWSWCDWPVFDQMLSSILLLYIYIHTYTYLYIYIWIMFVWRVFWSRDRSIIICFFAILIPLIPLIPLGTPPQRAISKIGSLRKIHQWVTWWVLVVSQWLILGFNRYNTGIMVS